MTRRKLSSIWLLTWTSFFGQLVHPVGEEGIGYMGWVGMAVILAS